MKSIIAMLKDKKFARAIYPLFGILVADVAILFSDSYSLPYYLGQACLWICIGIQWIGIRRTTAERKEANTEHDNRVLKHALAAAPDSDLMQMYFFVPYKENKIRTWCSNLNKRTALSLYAYEYNMHNGSPTKFYVTDEDMFHLKLHGCIRTIDPKLIQKGITYLTEKDRTKFMR